MNINNIVYEIIFISQQIQNSRDFQGRRERVQA